MIFNLINRKKSDIYRNLFIFLIHSFFILKSIYANWNYYDSSYVNLRTSYSFLKKDNIANLYSFSEIQENKNSLILSYNNKLRNDFFYINSKSYFFLQNQSYQNGKHKNELKLSIKELYASASLDSVYFSVGRKEIRNHFSYIHRILNVFSHDINNSDNIREEYLVPEKDLVDVEYIVDNFSSYIAYIYNNSLLEKIATDNKFKKKSSSYFTSINKLSILSSRTDILTIYAYKEENSEHVFGTGFNQLLSDSFVIYGEFKFQFSSNLLHLYDSREDMYETVLGGHNSFKNNISLYLEYYFNGRGYSDSEWKKIKKDITETPLEERHKFLPLLYPSDYKIRQHYLSLMIRDINIFDIEVHFIHTLSLNDLSWRSIVELKKAIGHRIQFSFRTSSYVNNNFSNFGLVPLYSHLDFSIKYFL